MKRKFLHKVGLATVGSSMILLSFQSAAAFSWQEFKQKWLTPPGEIVLKERLSSRWSALSLADLTLQAGEIPRAHDAAAFLSAHVISDSLKLLEGSQLIYNREGSSLAGSSVTLQRVELVPGIGQMSARLSLRAATKDGAISLSLDGEALVLAVGIKPGDDDDPAYLRMRLEPLSIRPSAEIGFFSFAAKRFWASLGADALRLLADTSLFEFRIPFTDHTALSLGIDETKTEKVNDSGATLTYRTTLPPSTIEQKFSAWPPLVTPAGIWILARRTEKGQIETNPPPAPDPGALSAAVAALEAKVSAMLPQPPAKDLELFLSGAAFSDMARRIGSLPSEKRTITIEVIGAAGRLADIKWRDKILGEGGAYAELAKPPRGKATLEMSVQDVRWSKNALVLALSGQLKASAPVHVHVDPLIGGGAGTDIGIEGSSNNTVIINVKVRALDSQNARFVIVEATPECGTITAEVTSDGRLKADFGWTSVPKIGARMAIPLGREPLPPPLLVDTRPQFVEIAPRDPDGEKGPWRVRPAWGGGIFHLTEVDGEMEDARLHAGAKVRVDRAAPQGESAAVKAAKEDVAKETRTLLDEWRKVSEAVQDEDTGCNAKGNLEVLLGDIAIGPNNEVVKFLRNAWNDLVKGPGDNNEAVKAGQKIADALNAFSPHDDAARALTREIANASAKIFGENSPVTKTFASVDKEVNKVLDDPARAAMDAPRNAITEGAKAVGNTVREGKKAVDTVVRGVGDAGKKAGLWR
ncbi:hypothetical protein SAMN05216573_10510 [Bradyrhizobium sp. Rc3b]|uniref:hypothetical protein n=1 Tax=Bradyrhizobium sp. Rc3b TaxID=1855322 RepID=UPI0008E14DE9|nr:hypothetical protein [Bradyrhizobium sp. Rc3b]SFM85464.1 hypothetical protein SAMN05216573_10510 [Bradyrhizobium sp. Rc3b]